MDKLLRLYTYVDGVNDTPFPNSDNPIEIGEFRYDAKRMGGAPTITASVYYPSCLDEVWADKVYAKFNGEKYYLKQTPTSSYNNESTMYKHDLELVSERVILDNVYFFDTVVGDPQGDDKPISNSTKVVFFGNIHEFVKRLNSSLEYAKLLKWEDGVDDNGNAIKIPKGYYVVVDNNENITTEEKLMSFEDQFFSNVLQEIYNTYEVPYYFEGKTIHIGFSNKNAVVPTFSYGVDDALLSITKNNANYKIVNRATATGSSDNIPFCYPHNSPKGDITATPSGNFEVKILDTELYSNEIKLDGVIRKSNVEYENEKVGFGGKDNYDGETLSAVMGKGGIDKKCVIEFISKEAGIFLLSFSSSVTRYILEEEEKSDATFRIRYFIEVYDRTANKFTYDSNGNLSSIEDFEVPVLHANHKYEIFIKCYYAAEGKYAGKGGRIEYNATYSFGSKSGWMYEDKVVDLKDVGLEVVGDTVVGDTITQTLVKYIKTSQNLMPSIYRETDGEERFYNATNDTYEGVEFNNPYVEGKPKEHIFTVEDIKPTIEGTEVNGLRIDMFSEFAYDNDDNDETYEDEEGNVYFKHPYFYGKLRVMDFNLFDHAIEQQPMTISFTSGHCGACNFEIGVTEDYPQKNPVQVDEYGNLVRDENGMVLAGVEGTQQLVTTFQERQQDTSKYEVWIALKKEEDTYGILMPKALKFNEAGEQIEAGHRPKACTEGQNDGDTFVIIGINLPQSHIINAEKKLEAEIIKYLKDNNDEKFTFSIGFSRIYFEENNILDQLSENSKIRIIYDNKPYDLYVSSFSYSMSEGEVLPEIRVELDETLKVSQNALQNAISQVKSELGRAIGSIDVVGAATPYFIRKDTDDEAQGRINFKKGIKFGEGGKVEIMPDNGAKLTIDYIEVTKKATFNSLEIAEKKHVGGQILLTSAAMKCGEVEEFDDYYRCYFQTKSEGRDEIFNQFAVNDQAICQTFNAWGSRYYWRLVVGVGEAYIDLSKTDCDEYSDIPSVGDSIILLGNRTDITRQSAIVLSAYDDDAPSLIMYNGINSYSLVEKNITGIIWNPETKEPQMYSYGSFFFGDRQLNKNFITFQKKDGDTDKNLYINGKLTIGAGSAGLSNLEEWSDKQTQINNAESTANKAKNDAVNAQATANDAKQKAENAQSRAGILESTTSNLSTQITDLENNVTNTVEEINKRLDGVVENYFEEGVPTLENYPANQWETDDEKKNHIGDTYTNINTYEVDPDNAGKSWRWVYQDAEHSGYHWHPIADSDAVKALQDAAKAQSTADGKSTTFLRQPTNYSKGDLWVLQSDSDHTAGKKGEILTANTSSAAYNASHWSKEIIYTDDKALEEFLEGAYKETVNNLKEQIQNTSQILDGMNNDKVLDSTEKSYIRTLWENINGIPSLVTVGSTGSYISTLEIVEKAGYKSGQDVLLTFNGKILVFNGKNLKFNHLGIEDFKVTYLNLRQYLADMRLYDSIMTEGYDRLKMSSLFTAYYDAQGKLLENAQYYYADMSAKDTLNQFIQGDYADEIAGLKASLDEKAETYMQKTDPASSWTTDEVKAKHVSDIWWNSSDSEVSGVDAGATAIYRYDGTKYYWEQSPVPKAIFDEIDGKNSIYVSKPTNYKARDMWIMEDGLTAGDVPADCMPGDMLIATSASETYSAAHWKKYVRYTDDSKVNSFINGEFANYKTQIQLQIDKKAQTWYQSEDPSKNWTTEEKKEHIGDMWLNSSSLTVSGIESGMTAIWNGTEWKSSEVPQDVFDKIDGKSSLFVNKPTSYHKNDMWIIGNDTSSSDMPSEASMGDLMVSIKDSSSFDKSHWVKKVKYTDDKALEEFLEGAYKETVNNLKEQIQSTREAIERMNSDHVLDESEKSYIRTEWEKINGYPCFDKIGSTGSYQTTLDIIAASGYTIGEAVTLTFNGKKLTFNGKSLTFNYRGMDSFRSAYYNLRDFLDESELYNVGSTDGFDREKLARLFSAYYDAQAILIDNSQKYYASKKAEESASSYKDDMAKKLGYSSYADMETQVKKNGSIIMDGGYLNAQLIEAQAITSDMIAVEELFSQHIEANDMNLKTGCVIGDLSIGKYVNACGKADLVDSVHSKYTSVEPDGTYTHGTRLSSGGITITGEGQTDKYCLSSNEFSVNASRSPILNEKPIVKITAYERPALSAYGKCLFYTSVDGDNIVIEIDNGMISGLRPMSKKITANSYYLTEYDHTLFCTNSSTNLYLPEFPLVGQEYVILVPNGGVDVYGNGKKIYLFYDGIDRDSYTCGDLATRTEQRLYWNQADNKWWATYIRY